MSWTMVVIYMKPYTWMVFLHFLFLAQCQECTDRCINGGICNSFANGSICSCPDGFSGSRCELRARYAPLMFLCDPGASLIFESSADALQFHSLPLPNLRQPVAVGYDYDDDVILWIDAEDGSLNRAKRNGEGYGLFDVGHNVIDLAIHVPSKTIAWINAQRTLSGVFNYSNGVQGRTLYGNNFSTVAAHLNGDFYVIDNVQSNVDVHILNNSFYPVTTFVNTELTLTRSLVLNRHGTRLFIIDDQKKTIESFGPDGADHVTLFSTDNSIPVDIAWYRGVPMWTESVTTRGVILLNGQRGVSPASTNLIHFVNPAGIQVYHGQSYSKRLDESCLADEVSCSGLCIPSAWRCDGLTDCVDGSDETSCDPTEDSGSLLFVTSLSGAAIYMANTNNLDFRKLPFLFIQSPVAVDYDVKSNEVYWTDVQRKTISAARIDGSNQRIVVQGLGVPDGLFIDSDNETIFWTDTEFNTIEAIHFDGSNQRILINDIDMPRAIIIVPRNRKLYWTDWGDTPKIEMSNRDGSGREVVVDTELGWPNGITYDRQASRLIWCDARLDKIESSDLTGADRRILLDITQGVFHPFGVIVHDGAVMWSDWVLNGVGVQEEGNHTWPGLYATINVITQPSGFHVAVDLCSNEPCIFGTCQLLTVSDYECECLKGYTGKDCDTEITCNLPREPEDSHIEDPKEEYSPGERITIKCDNDEGTSTSWICNATSGEWDVIADLTCQESSNLTGTSIAIASGIVLGIALLVSAVCVGIYLRRKCRLPATNGNSPQPHDRGTLPSVPPDDLYTGIDGKQHYYSSVSTPNDTRELGHTYMSVIEDKVQNHPIKDQPRYSYHNSAF